MNTTETIILECNNAESIKAQDGGLPNFTNIDKSTWTNNFQSVEINRGDSLTMEYAIINQIGANSESIEFNPVSEAVPDREYNSNSVIFETEFYIVHNGINSVGLPCAADNTQTSRPVADVSSQQLLGNYLLPAGLGEGNNGNVIVYNAKCRNRLLQTDSKKYTLLNFMFMPNKQSDLWLETFNHTDKRYIQYQTEKTFMTPDNIANELTIKFHETNTNGLRRDGIQLPNVNNPQVGDILPAGFTSYQAPNAGGTGKGRMLAQGSYTLNGSTLISRPCNGVNVTLDGDASSQSQQTLAEVYSQMAVLFPDKWIGGTYLNSCATYDLLGETDYNPAPATAQVYPRILSRYLIDGLTQTAQFPFDGVPTIIAPATTLGNSISLGANMPIFTNILANTDNLDKIKRYLDATQQYWGDNLNEADALQNDKLSWDSIWDIGRTSIEAPDIGMGRGIGGTGNDALEKAMFHLTGHFICPTESGYSTNEFIDPLKDTVDGGGGISIQPFFTNLQGNFTLIDQSYQGDTHSFTIDPAHIDLSLEAILDNQEVYNYARDNNIGAYTYKYIDEAGDEVSCLFFLTSQYADATTPARFSSGNYFGFSPSFYDNKAVWLINKDKASNITDFNPNPYINLGATDPLITYTSATNSFGISYLHTERRWGWKDDTQSTTNIGNKVVKFNELIAQQGNIQSVNGRSSFRLDPYIVTAEVADSYPFDVQYDNGVDPDPVDLDVNTGISDAISGVWIKNVYFGRPNFNPDKYTNAQFLQYGGQRLLDSVAIKATKENWYGSLLWKMGGEYIDFYSQFTNLTQHLRFNNSFWRNKGRIRSCGILTTNSNIDCSLAPALNVGGLGQAGNYQGLINYQLGYNNNVAVTLGEQGSAVMFFSGEIKKSETGFYRIYTDFCNPTYLDGAGGNLNVIGLALKSYNSNDFFYSYSPSYQLIADRDYVLTNITTSIRNSDGLLANVGDRCVIVYKITKPRTILEPPSKTKSSEEQDLEEVIGELKELNQTTDLNNMILSGSRGSVGGGGGGTFRSSDTATRTNTNKDRMQQQVQPIIGDEVGELPSSSSFVGVGNKTGGRGAVDYDRIQTTLTRELIKNIMDRIPTGTLIDRTGRFNYRQYISRVSRATTDLYPRFIARFNELIGVMESIRRSQAPDKEERLRRVSEELRQVVGGVEINEDGENFLSVPLGARGEGQPERINTRISGGGLELILNDLRLGATQGDLEQSLLGLVDNSNLQVEVRGRGQAELESPRTTRNPLSGTKKGAIPKPIRLLIAEAQKQTDGTQGQMIQFIDARIRNLRARPAETFEEDRQQEADGRLLFDTRSIIQFGDRSGAVQDFNRMREDSLTERRRQDNRMSRGLNIETNTGRDIRQTRDRFGYTASPVAATPSQPASVRATSQQEGQQQQLPVYNAPAQSGADPSEGRRVE